MKLSKEKCEETGHLDVALSHIGRVLYYSPKDQKGFWINEEVAKVLNSIDVGKMLEGFSSEVYNSRGVHWVDPSGKPEIELTEKYRGFAEKIENIGYFRFAATLKTICYIVISDTTRTLIHTTRCDDVKISSFREKLLINYNN
ncbi:hypothetical protein AWH56_021735 [Anaerobacillus isosaccharinicus]|uniref:Uncharacterized protein n=1 Tax=Anaerobacillus isosaccharinicus TaxID=1532552 RepID=A0A1S2MHH4_9BACI|nr:hypothetical protein [Anaerobacillus isosaccharinicus]MBA5586475.1 hypothetical protein [Anaerobacillus isosaccharinicus]QOY35283.1 hypothetical protein AWH56_021735 [Anaerobacillus isosaccharinicus]